eukprot:Nk52_evm51s343 gene=Nk52_evmTU51s343
MGDNNNSEFESVEAFLKANQEYFKYQTPASNTATDPTSTSSSTTTSTSTTNSSEVDANTQPKIVCVLTGHEMGGDVKVGELMSYRGGRRFRKALRDNYDYKKHEPYIVTQGSRLFCNLTNRIINRDPEHVERHIRGKRYIRKLELAREKERQEAELAAQNEGAVEEEMWVPEEEVAAREDAEGVEEEQDGEDLNEEKEDMEGKEGQEADDCSMEEMSEDEFVSR